MAVINRIAEFYEEMAGWRQHLHAHPELDLDCFETADFVAARLAEFGITDVTRGIARTGLVAIIEGQGAGPTIGLRADMDALPILEAVERPYASKTKGVMHACGHDGHTTMLLGAAKYLAETRNFAGRVALIFQPAEELSGGGRIMVDEGIMERFDISEVYGMHNAPGIDLGVFATRPGPLMASADTFEIKVIGQGAHGAYPQDGIDPVFVAIQIAQGLQGIKSRMVDTHDALVLSITMIHAGTAENIVPQEATMGGTIRTLSQELREDVARRLTKIAETTAAAYGAVAEVVVQTGYPVTVNTVAQTDFAVDVARGVVGKDKVVDDMPAEMGSEDFSYMLEARPGAYVFLGQGEGAGLHHPEYDFNDEISPIGASWFVKLVETAQPL